MFKKVVIVCAVSVAGFGSGGRSALSEDDHRTESSDWKNSVFSGSESYSTNLMQSSRIGRKRHVPHSSFVQEVDFSAPVRDALSKVHELAQNDEPASFLETTDWKRLFTPFSSLEESKAAQLKIEAADEALAEKEAITGTKIEAFKSELESQIDAARKAKKLAQENLARSSFLQRGLAPDFASREFAKINEMERGWKLAADRMGHAELASANEPSAALIDANSRVEADRKKMNRISAMVTADMQKVDNDESIVQSQQAKLRQRQEQTMYV